MKTIRQSIFETNSSSTHSLTISRGLCDGLTEEWLPNDYGFITVPTGDFGWEEEYYYDAPTKAGYLSIYARDWACGKESEFRQILYDVIAEQTECQNIVFEADDNEGSFSNGYIDHQSVEDNDLDYLFEDPELIRDFIFNKRSVLKTDNDNH